MASPSKTPILRTSLLDNLGSSRDATLPKTRAGSIATASSRIVRTRLGPTSAAYPAPKTAYTEPSSKGLARIEVSTRLALLVPADGAYPDAMVAVPTMTPSLTLEVAPRTLAACTCVLSVARRTDATRTLKVTVRSRALAVYAPTSLTA